MAEGVSPMPPSHLTCMSIRSALSRRNLGADGEAMDEAGAGLLGEEWRV